MEVHFKKLLISQMDHILEIASLFFGSMLVITKFYNFSKSQQKNLEGLVLELYRWRAVHRIM